MRFAGFIIALLASLVRSAITETGLSQIECLSGFDWMRNSKGQSPCLVAAYLGGACSTDAVDVNSEVPDVRRGFPFPSKASDDCFCNTVMYSLLEACAICQESPLIPRSKWTQICSGPLLSQFPRAIPQNTAVPAWAYHNNKLTDVFNGRVLVRQDTSDHTSAILPTSSPSSSLSPTAPGDSVSTDTPESASSPPKSNVGPIVGGVMGGVAVLAVVAVGATDWYKHRRTSKRAASSELSSDSQLEMNSLWLPDTEDKLLGAQSSTALPGPTTGSRHHVVANY